MASPSRPSPTATFLLSTLLATLLTIPVAAKSIAQPAQPSTGLTTIDNPGGGQLIYGPLTNATTRREAMASLLRLVHTHFGERPQIDRFFSSKDSDIVATFFRLTAKSQGNATTARPIAGMVLLDLAEGAKNGNAAVLYDSAATFAKNQPAMMKTLSAAWQHNTPSTSNAINPHRNPNRTPTDQFGSSQSPHFDNIGTIPGGVFGVNITPDQSLSAPLHLARVSDNTASIGLAQGWEINNGSSGSLHAQGPHGESLHMGVLFGNIYDPQTQQGASMISYLRHGTTPFASCPFLQDLPADFECVASQVRQRNNQPALSIRILNRKLSPSNPLAGAFLAETDFHDGKGPMLTSLHLTAQKMGPGSWILTVNQANVPRSLAQSDDEWPTIQAMIMSYRQNEAVLQGQSQQIINQINARAAANRQLAQARSDANDAHNKQVESTWDDQSKRNKAFENYTLDRAIVQDNEVPAHGTFTYPTADWLVKADPTRFQYVATQDLLKGIDY